MLKYCPLSSQNKGENLIVLFVSSNNFLYHDELILSLIILSNSKLLENILSPIIIWDTLLVTFKVFVANILKSEIHLNVLWLNILSPILLSNQWISLSTNASKDGWTPSEKNVLRAINDIFDRAEGRLIVSTFSSNVSRIQQILDCALKHERKCVIVGRSMVTAVECARKFGYIIFPDSYFKEVEDLDKLKDKETLILCTGSQGEAMAALNRIAKGTFKGIRITPGDTVVFSSSPIPGNGVSISKVINQLTRMGAEVITNSILRDIHSSGHPSRIELKLNLKLFKPKYFMPVHGEYHMLKLHGDIAKELGMKKDNVFILSNGDTLMMENGVIEQGMRFQADDVYIDGYDINGVSTAVISDRKILQDDGMVSVLVFLDSKNSRLIAPVRVNTVGFVSYGTYENHLTRHASTQVEEGLNQLFASKHVTFNDIKNTVRSVVSKYYFRKTQRNPMIIPLILDKRGE